MSSVEWRSMAGSGAQEAQCALLDELIEQTTRVADEQRTANLIALWGLMTDLKDGESLTFATQAKADHLHDEISKRLGLAGDPS